MPCVLYVVCGVMAVGGMVSRLGRAAAALVPCQCASPASLLAEPLDIKFIGVGGAVVRSWPRPGPARPAAVSAAPDSWAQRPHRAPHQSHHQLHRPHHQSIISKYYKRDINPQSIVGLRVGQ